MVSALPVWKDGVRILIVGVWTGGGKKDRDPCPLRRPHIATTIGETNDAGPALFGRVGDVAILSGRRIAIVDRFANEVRVFTWSGEHLWTAGGSGAGPGEFQTIGRAFRSGAGIAVSELLIPDVSFFDEDGAFVNRVRISWPHGFSAPSVIGVTQGGRILVLAPLRSAAPVRVGIRRDTVSLLVFESDGRAFVEIATVPGRRTFIEEIAGNAIRGRPVVFDAEPLFASGPSGIAVARQDSFAIRIYDSRGRLEGVMSRPVAPTLVDESLRESYIAYRTSLVRDESRKRALRRELTDAPYSDYLPVIDQIAMDDDGQLWIKEYIPSFRREGDTWSAWTLEGERLAVLRLPSDFTAYAFDDHWVVGVSTKALGQEQVQILAISIAEEDS